MVGVRRTGAALCRSTGLLQHPYFLMFLIKELKLAPEAHYLSPSSMRKPYLTTILISRLTR